MVDNIQKRPTPEEQLPELPIIQLPQELSADAKTQRLDSLERKLHEYNGRIAAFRSKDPYRAPEAYALGIGVADGVMGSVMKHFILEEFLENPDEGVDTKQALQYFTDFYGIENLDNRQWEAWENAVAVIEDYVRTGGANTEFGGLS